MLYYKLYIYIYIYIYLYLYFLYIYIYFFATVALGSKSFQTIYHFLCFLCHWRSFRYRNLRQNYNRSSFSQWFSKIRYEGQASCRSYHFPFELLLSCLTHLPSILSTYSSSLYCDEWKVHILFDIWVNYA